MTEKHQGENLAEALERARVLGPKLAQAADKLNESIERVEKALVALQLGVRAEVVLEAAEDGWYRSLVFGKNDGKSWRLWIEAGDILTEEISEASPLVNASREVRLQAVEELPQLVKNLLTAAEEEFDRVEDARLAAESVITALSGRPK